MSAHTPGPWRVVDLPGSPNEAHVFFPPPFGAGYVAVHGSRFRREANAALIAATPELLWACKRLIGSLHVMVGDGDNDPDIVFARAAIAKAEGKA